MSNRNNEDEWSFVILIVAFIACFGSVCITKSINDRCWTNQALKHNAAHFDTKTGVFQWNE